jgi:hypothetical protein
MKVSSDLDGMDLDCSKFDCRHLDGELVDGRFDPVQVRLEAAT